MPASAIVTDGCVTISQSYKVARLDAIETGVLAGPSDTVHHRTATQRTFDQGLSPPVPSRALIR